MFCPKMKKKRKKKKTPPLDHTPPYIAGLPGYGPRPAMVANALGHAHPCSRTHARAPPSLAKFTKHHCSRTSFPHAHARACASTRLPRFCPISSFRELLHLSPFHPPLNLIYHTYICVYVHAHAHNTCPRARLGHARLGHACASGIARSPYEHHTPSRKHVQVINYPNGCSTEIQ